MARQLRRDRAPRRRTALQDERQARVQDRRVGIQRQVDGHALPVPGYGGGVQPALRSMAWSWPRMHALAVTRRCALRYPARRQCYRLSVIPPG
eukprot:5290753-Pleurochrysis_carterae.AAC.2